MKKSTIAILGAGSWGTAVAIHLASCGNRVLLWAHRSEHVSDMVKAGRNVRYLPDAPFPPTLIPIDDLNDCFLQASHIIIAVPSHAFTGLLSRLPKPQLGLAWLTKGIDPSSHELLSTLVAKKWGESLPVAIISGPSFAKEVAQGLPTALTIAGNNKEHMQALRELLHFNRMRTYLSDDLIGVQLCGAVKNVLAIATGISDGMGYGANAKAALITRGLAEMTRLGVELGARQETFLGLAGVGDLVLTCTDDQSRNRRFGRLLGQEVELTQAEKQIGQVVEGKYNASQVCAIANQHQIDMPICKEINALLLGKITAKQVVDNLMNRPPRNEE